ncbi:hypothetical protein HNQ85_003505 [Anoxybacillus calidus]|uniref:Toxin n=1 Tax=[Anoxybacillus] calidus TaxID=575178 RepID=A0A7V9Z321_9BACL|nr:type II toxin-antitoxin system MqsR family toxin [Anoxybacillus calidus]MBA2873167.1 hypothetical protein [Anoxybacillus calidus]
MSLQIQLINRVLVQIKRIISESPDNFRLLTTREKNERTLLKLGFTPNNARDEILRLSYKDYIAGPEDNKSEFGSKEGNIWEFGKKINGLDIYIKIHLVPTKYGTQCVCISFHEAEFPLSYPYK